MCIFKGCQFGKLFNYEGLPPKYCGKHKLEGMIDIKHERCDECRYQASFGFIEENKRVKCRTHMIEGMINLKHKNIRCKGYLCGSCKQPNHNGYCSEKCYISNNLQEYDLLRRSSPEGTYDLLHTYNEHSGILYKEYLIFKHLKETYPDHNIIWDKIYSCQYRPDFCISFDEFTLIIEIDEDQHKSYDKENEINRIENIYHTKGKPMYVVRFNPDTYKRDGIEIHSPFIRCELIDVENWTNRLQDLTYTINTCINNGLNDKGPHTYEIIRLFYDDA